MIIEETITTVLKKFITTDGTSFLSDGPNKSQIKLAKSKAESHEEKFDFLYFEINDEFLKEYKSENWHHYKWYFARNNFFCKNRWSNGIISEPAIYSISFYNNVTEEDFLFLIKKCLMLPNSNEGITFYSNCFFNDKFLDIIFFSGIIDLTDIKNDPYYSTIIFNKILKTMNIELLEKLVNNNIITITTKCINTVSNYFDCNKYLSVYKLKGTLNKVKKDSDTNDYNEFCFKSNDEIETYFKKCLSLCTIKKEDILRDILYNGNWDLFLNSTYGAISLFYQYYNNLNEPQSFKKAEGALSELLLTYKRHDGYQKYSYLKKYAKSDNELKLILNSKKNA